MARKIKGSTLILVCIDGVALQTTVEMLRQGTLSTALCDAFRDFESEHIATGILY